MTLRSKFRTKFSNSSLYPFMRMNYRFFSSILFSVLRIIVKFFCSLLGFRVIFPRYAVITVPLEKPTIVIRGFNGVTLIGRKHYFSRKKFVRNYLDYPEVQDFISGIKDFTGLRACPISILETALIKEGTYRIKSLSTLQKAAPTHFVGNQEGADIYVPRQSSFFHFYVQVVPFILQNSQVSKLWLNLDSNSSNLNILHELGVQVNEVPSKNHLMTFSKSVVQNNHYPASSEVQVLRGRLAQLGFLRSSERNLYITRRGNINGRRIQNETELVSMLERFNFEVIDPGELSFNEQLSIFGQARVVIAPHGAALSHIVSFPLEARILELNGDDDIRWHIRKMALSIGISHELILGISHSDGSFTVNLKLVEEFLLTTKQ